MSGQRDEKSEQRVSNERTDEEKVVREGERKRQEKRDRTRDRNYKRAERQDDSAGEYTQKMSGRIDEKNERAEKQNE